MIQRVLTSVVVGSAVLAVVLFVPPDVAFVVFAAAFFIAAMEFLRIARQMVDSAPLVSLRLWVPLAMIGGFLTVRADATAQDPGMWLITGVSLMVLAAALMVLLPGTEIRDGLAAIGALAFAIPYFSIPPICLYRLQTLDPWLLFLLAGIVWLGDSAAYLFGRKFGRHKLAPLVSPKKTWEGAFAGFVISLVAAAVWSQWRLGEVRLELLVVAALTSVAAQLGDLVESMIKRGAGVKDSGHLLPGHGGFFDRLDALLLATPVFLLGVWVLGAESLIPR